MRWFQDQARPPKPTWSGKSPMSRYIRTVRRIRKERGEFCEICGAPATHGHHVIPVGETGIDAELVFLEANIMILCDWCHKMQHPGMREWSWDTARILRGQALHRT